MFDLSWSEILLIGGVAVVVMKPEDIPKAMLAAGRVMRRFQYVKFALSQQFEDIMKAGDLDELRKANFEKSENLPDLDEAEGDLDDYHHSLKPPSTVIPAQAGIQPHQPTEKLDPHLRGDDDKKEGE